MKEEAWKDHILKQEVLCLIQMKILNLKDIEQIF